MFHSRIRPIDQVDAAAAFHPQYCACTDCAIASDPIGYRARRRAVVAWAALFSAIAVGFYAFALALAPQVAAAFGAGL